MDADATSVHITLFGGVRIRRQGSDLPPGPAQQRAVLALLALGEGRAVGRAALTAALWPAGPPPSGWNVVQTHVKRLRAVLEPDRSPHRPSALIPASGDGYALRLGSDDVDVWRFRRLVERAAGARRRDDQAAAHALLREALALWCGPPAPDVAQVAGHPAVRALEGLRATAVARYLDAAVALGHGADVVGLAEEAARDQPLDELAQTRLVRVYRAAGRRADAFEHVRRTRGRLADELGVDPGPELAAAFRALLDDDRESPATPVAAVPDRLPVPMQLPADVPDFVGRTAQLAALDAIGPVAAVSGPAGVGKTALMIRWSHRVADRFPDGCLYADLRGYGPSEPVEPAEALTRFLGALGIPRAEAPSDPDELAARYRSMLAGRRMLILLDNARSPAHARPLLPGTPGCVAVVTSRSDLAGLVVRDGARRVAVEPFADAEAFALLHRLVGTQAEREPGAVATLAEACGRLPLALRIAAERVASRPGSPLADLVADFADHRGRLDALSAGGDDVTAVRAVFSWSTDALGPEAARAFRLLGLHPGREADLFGLAALTGTPVREARRAADELTRLHLVAVVGADRFTMHDLVRDYARELAEHQESEPERRAAAIRLIDELARGAAAAMDVLYPHERLRRPDPGPYGESERVFADAAQAEAFLAGDTETLLAAVRLAADLGLPRRVGFLSGTLHRFLATAGAFGAMLDLHALAARLLHDVGDEEAEGAALRDLGATCHRLARYPEASEHLTQALAMARKHGDRAGESSALHGLGIVVFRTGDLGSALALFEEALAVNRALGDRAAEGQNLGNIGLVYEFRGDKDRALDFHRRALEIHRDSGFRVGEGDALNNMAVVHRQCGRLDEAVELLGQALAVYREINDRGGEGAVLNNLGLAATIAGRWTEARRHLEEALEAHPAGSLGVEAETLNILALLELTAGHPAESAEYSRRALALGELTADLGIQTNAHHGLGEARRALGDRAAAGEHHRRALELARRTGSRADEARAVEALGLC